MKIGIDLGGTKTEIIVLDDKGREVLRHRVPTPTESYEGTLRTISDLVALADDKFKTQGLPVGIGTPGALSPRTGFIKNSNSTCLIGKPLDRDLQKLLNRPVKLANDANCFALSEATDGAAQGASVVFGVILGTGVGGGLTVDRKLLVGANAIAGEWGHNSLPWMTKEEFPGPECYCGKRGCIETFLSGPGLAHDHFKVTGEKLKGEEIAKHSGETMGRYEDRLARALASVINIVDPDAIVLGGGVSNNKRLYQNVPGLLRKYVFSDEVTTKILQARHGDSSGVRGAAWL